MISHNMGDVRMKGQHIRDNSMVACLLWQFLIRVTCIPQAVDNDPVTWFRSASNVLGQHPNHREAGAKSEVICDQRSFKTIDTTFDICSWLPDLTYLDGPWQSCNPAQDVFWQRESARQPAEAEQKPQRR